MTFWGFQECTLPRHNSLKKSILRMICTPYVMRSNLGTRYSKNQTLVRQFSQCGKQYSRSRPPSNDIAHYRFGMQVCKRNRQLIETTPAISITILKQKPIQLRYRVVCLGFHLVIIHTLLFHFGRYLSSARTSHNLQFPL
jgi:hypothetical protein